MTASLRQNDHSNPGKLSNIALQTVCLGIGRKVGVTGDCWTLAIGDQSLACLAPISQP